MSQQIKFKCKVLHLGKNHPRLEDNQLESSLEEYGLGILVNTNLNVSKQCTLVGPKSESILD